MEARIELATDYVITQLESIQPKWKHLPLHLRSRAFYRFRTLEDEVIGVLNPTPKGTPRPQLAQ